MKLRVEYKKAPSHKSFIWTFGYSEGPFTGQYGELRTFNVQHKNLAGAVLALSRHFQHRFRKKIIDFSILQRCSVKQPIAVSQALLADYFTGGAQ